MIVVAVVCEQIGALTRPQGGSGAVAAVDGTGGAAVRAAAGAVAATAAAVEGTKGALAGAGAGAAATSAAPSYCCCGGLRRTKRRRDRLIRYLTRDS